MTIHLSKTRVLVTRKPEIEELNDKPIHIITPMGSGPAHL